MMGKASFREPFRGGLQDVRFAPYGDAGALEAEFAKAEAVGTPIAAFIVEPIQGEPADCGVSIMPRWCPISCASANQLVAV